MAKDDKDKTDQGLFFAIIKCTLYTFECSMLKDDIYFILGKPNTN